MMRTGIVAPTNRKWPQSPRVRKTSMFLTFQRQFTLVSALGNIASSTPFQGPLVETRFRWTETLCLAGPQPPEKFFLTCPPGRTDPAVFRVLQRH
jgi:hypothetical protein